jgi:isoleucyl-tRNA synthetase
MSLNISNLITDNTNIIEIYMCNPLKTKEDLKIDIHINNDMQKLESNFLDGWIYEVINNLAYDVDTWMINYDISKSINALLDFIEDLTNYYIKLNRSALKGQNGVDEWQNSLGVLYNVLKTYLLILSSFAPFLTEYLYDHIKLIDSTNLNSIHLYSYPDTTNQLMFVPKFNMLKRILKIVRAERHKTQTHMSQKTPIASCKIRMNSQEQLEEIKKFIHLISGELNCMELTYGEYDSELEYTIELNHRELGKKFRNVANDIKEKLMNLTQDEYVNALTNNNIDIIVNDITYVVIGEMFTIKKIPKKGSNTIIDNELMIQLDFTYNDVIKNRHIINCFVTHFQNHRKRVGLRPWNKVDLVISSDEDNIVKPQQEVFESRTNVPVIYNCEEEKYVSTYTETYTHNLENKDINIRYSLCVYKDN